MCRFTPTSTPTNSPTSSLTDTVCPPGSTIPSVDVWSECASTIAGLDPAATQLVCDQLATVGDCDHTCAICRFPTDAPTGSPTNAPSEGCPVGTTSINRIGNADCDTLLSTFVNFCLTDAMGACDRTCGHCRSPTDVPTHSPSAAPSATPSASPTLVPTTLCAPGGVSFNFYGDEECAGLLNNFHGFCEQDAFGLCNLSCGRCTYPTFSPTTSPTASPTSRPTMECLPGTSVPEFDNWSDCDVTLAGLSQQDFENLCQRLPSGHCDNTCGICRFPATTMPTATPTYAPSASPMSEPSLCLPPGISVNRFGDAQCEVLVPEIPNFCSQDAVGACDAYCGFCRYATPSPTIAPSAAAPTDAPTVAPTTFCGPNSVSLNGETDETCENWVDTIPDFCSMYI